MAKQTEGRQIALSRKSPPSISSLAGRFAPYREIISVFFLRTIKTQLYPVSRTKEFSTLNSVVHKTTTGLRRVVTDQVSHDCRRIDKFTSLCYSYTKLIHYQCVININGVHSIFSHFLLNCRMSETLNKAVSPFFLEQLAADVFILCVMALHITVVSPNDSVSHFQTKSI